MALWPRSVAADVRHSLRFLVAERGYRVAADSDGGMAGSIAYRSAALWVVAEWDRGDPWLEVTPAGLTTERFPGAAVAAWLGVPPPGPGALGAAPTAALAGWLRAHLPALEARFTPGAAAASLRSLAAGTGAGLAARPPGA